MCGHVTNIWLNCCYALGPVHQRTLNLNRWQQSEAHPVEFICYFSLRVRLAVCLVQLLSKTQDLLIPSLSNGSPGELNTVLSEAFKEYFDSLH